MEEKLKAQQKKRELDSYLHTYYDMSFHSYRIIACIDLSKQFFFISLIFIDSILSNIYSFISAYFRLKFFFIS